MIQNHAGTIIGVVLLVAVVWLVIAIQGAHGHGDVVLSIASASPAPTPTVAPLPTPTPAPDLFAPARWAAANVAVIVLMLAIGVGLPAGIALHGLHRSRLIEPNTPPLPYTASMLADPDALNQEGLASRLAGLGIQPEAMAHEPSAVLRLVMEAQHEVMNRKGQGGHADTRPYILVVGELPEVLKTLNGRDTDRVRSALELIGGLSGRKHGVVTVMLAQSWTHAALGSVAMRNLVPTSTVFRVRPGGGRTHDRVAAWLLEGGWT